MEKENSYSSVSERVQKLMGSFDSDYKNRDPHQRWELYRQSHEANPEKSERRKSALGLVRFLENKDILLHEYDLLAGNIQHYDYTNSMPPPLPQHGPLFWRRGKI